MCVGFTLLYVSVVLLAADIQSSELHVHRRWRDAASQEESLDGRIIKDRQIPA